MASLLGCSPGAQVVVHEAGLRPPNKSLRLARGRVLDSSLLGLRGDVEHGGVARLCRAAKLESVGRAEQ